MSVLSTGNGNRGMGMDEGTILFYIREWAGWLVAIMVLVARSVPTWVRAFGETGNARTATLITGLQNRVNSQEQIIEHMANRLERAEEHYRRCEKENIDLRLEVAELRSRVEHGS